MPELPEEFPLRMPRGLLHASARLVEARLRLQLLAPAMQSAAEQAQAVGQDSEGTDELLWQLEFSATILEYVAAMNSAGGAVQQFQLESDYSESGLSLDGDGDHLIEVDGPMFAMARALEASRFAQEGAERTRELDRMLSDPDASLPDRFSWMVMRRVRDDLRVMDRQLLEAAQERVRKARQSPTV